MPALVALLDMPAQRAGTAFLNGARNYTLLPRSRKGFQVRCSVQAKHIPHLKGRAIHGRGSPDGYCAASGRRSSGLCVAQAVVVAT